MRSFLHGQKERIELGVSAGEHNGGDIGLMQNIAYIFHKAVYADSFSESKSSIESSLEGHWMAFAAEESRKKGVFVDLDAYKDEVVSTRGTVNI